MALFNISGYGDWEVSEVGEKLCQNFHKKHKKRRKRFKSNQPEDDNNNDNNRDKKRVRSPATSSFVQDQSGTLLNGKTKLSGQIRKKMKHRKVDDSVDDNLPLTSSSETTTNKVAKRKYSDVFVKKEQEKKKEPKELKSQDDSKIQKKRLKEHKKKKQKKHISSKYSEDSSPLLSNEPQRNEFNNISKTIDPVQLEKSKKKLEKLKHLLMEKDKTTHIQAKQREPVLTLRQKMMRKLKAARFRFLNEQIYSTTSKETQKIFKSDPDAFKAYHEGYKLQVQRWPLNPLDKIIKSLNKMNKSCVIADFGCGEGRLAQSVEQKVHSFDLVAVNETITACDMAHVPLEASSVDVAVFCLSLMGTNLKDYLLEANRVLKNGGLLKLAEVESRFEDVNTFIKCCEKFGFKKTWMDLSHNLFYFIDFKKEGNIKDRKKLPSISLNPCLYKKR